MICQSITQRSDLEENLLFQIKCEKLPIPKREFRFHPTRKWRSDFVWEKQRLIVEVEGGVWTKGRHVRGGGFIKDCEKYNNISLMGYKLLRVCEPHIKSGKAIKWIKQAISIIDNELILF